MKPSRIQLTTAAGEAPRQANQSLRVGMQCLLEVAAASGPVGCRDLARRHGLDASRVNRLLKTLASLGLLASTPRRKFTAGPGIHVLAAISLHRSRLLATAVPHLRRLAEKSGRLVSLGVLWQGHVCYLYHGGPEQPVEAAIASENLFPAERSSIGLMLLSHRPPEEAAQVLAGAGLAKPAADARLHELLDIRLRGFAVNPERSSIAVAVGPGPAAGLALAGGVKAKDVPGLLRQLRAAAAAIGKDLQE